MNHLPGRPVGAIRITQAALFGFVFLTTIGLPGEAQKTPQATPKGASSITIQPGECLNETLSNSDNQLNDGTFYDEFVLNWPGGDLTVTYDSPDYDEYLIVFQPPGYPDGTRTDVDAFSTDPEVFSLNDAPVGTYTIWANSFSPATGNYELCIGATDATPEPTATPTVTPTPSVTPTPTECVPEDAPANPSPADSASSASTTVTLSWNGAIVKKPLGPGAEKVIYGNDDRLDVYEVGNAARLDAADSVVVMVARSDLTDNGDGTQSLPSQSWAQSDGNLCPDEPFRDQPNPGLCSGFLAGPDLVVTAGHCINTGNCSNRSFVFGFEMTDANTPRLTFPDSDVYSCVEIVGSRLVGDEDWAVVRLDRPVVGHDPLPVRRSGTINVGQSLVVMGYPVGLPLKIDDGGNVRSNADPLFFVGNLDTFGGNSGSPVFNADTLVVEGVLVRGEVDFVNNGGCTASKQCADDACRGEDCSKTTEFADLLPEVEEFDVYFGPCGDLQLLGSTSNQTWEVSDLQEGSTYCWQVVAKGPCADSPGPVWSFTTQGVAPPTATPTSTATPPTDCDSGFYVLDGMGGRHKVGNPATISGSLFFGNDIARDLERAVCAASGTTEADLVVLDGFGSSHFVAGASCSISQDFYFGDQAASFPQGRALDLQISADSQGLWVLTDYGALYRAGSTKDPGEEGLLSGTDQTGVLGFDVPISGELRDPGLPNPGGATLRAISFIAIDEDRDSRAEGYVVLDTMGGRYHYLSNGNLVQAGFSGGVGADDPRKLIDPTGHSWPFFPGLDIARDMELHPTQQGVVVLDGWDGIHPVPVDRESNPVFFANNIVSLANPVPAQVVGLPYVTAGFDDIETLGQNESDFTVFGIDSQSVFHDLEFSAGCPSQGLYTMDKFGGVFALGSTRIDDAEPIPQFTGSPYFFPSFLAKNLEVFAYDESEPED